MAIRRVPIESAADLNHQKVQLEGDYYDELPNGKVYVDPYDGSTIDGDQGGTLGQLQGNEIEIPKTTWYQEE